MRSEDLILAAGSARGVDLLQASKISAKPTRNVNTKTKKIGSFTVVTLLPPAKYRAAGTADHPAVRARWSIAELGQAAKHVPPICFQAALYSYAGEESQYWSLWRALLDRARILAQEVPVWPTDCTDVHGLRMAYLERLCILVLDADRHAARFNAYPGLYAAWLHVTTRTWEHVLEPKFWALHAVWEDWGQTAARMIQSKLRSD